jgi:hypothetical protein
LYHKEGFEDRGEIIFAIFANRKSFDSGVSNDFLFDDFSPFFYHSFGICPDILGQCPDVARTKAPPNEENPQKTDVRTFV